MVTPKIKYSDALIPVPMEMLQSDVGWQYAFEYLSYFCEERNAFRLEGPPELIPDPYRFGMDVSILVFPIGRFVSAF